MFGIWVVEQILTDIKDIIPNDHYKPNGKIMDQWSIVIKKNGEGMWLLHCAYELKVPLRAEDKWVKLSSWAIKCIVVQGDYVVVDLEKNKDNRVTLILHSVLHPFEVNLYLSSSPEVGCFQ